MLVAPAVVDERRVSRKLTINLDQNIMNVRPIVKGTLLFLSRSLCSIDSQLLCFLHRRHQGSRLYPHGCLRRRRRPALVCSWSRAAEASRVPLYPFQEHDQFSISAEPRLCYASGRLQRSIGLDYSVARMPVALCSQYQETRKLHRMDICLACCSQDPACL